MIAITQHDHHHTHALARRRHTHIRTPCCLAFSAELLEELKATASEMPEGVASLSSALSELLHQLEALQGRPHSVHDVKRLQVWLGPRAVLLALA